ncbi:MAG TPA: ABC transporter ATP-binding protein [Solirubrobacteraceae bacterium]|nr:ABC transporter ATP-binding protein [Solirubrobacteraceae bacterium]
MSALELHRLVKRYQSGGGEVVRAVDGISLQVAPGELHALYGPSGSGKTTLLALLARLIEPDSGSIHFGGRDVTRLSAADSALYRRRDVGFVFQSFHLMAGATALSNAALKLIADGHSMNGARDLAQHWIERVGLAGRAEHLPAQLSMGERQRVAIARALVNEPRLLLMDEPTGNLDSARSREILALLRDVCHERRIPGVLVTHDPQATAFVDHVHTLRDGRLRAGVEDELVAP